MTDHAATAAEYESSAAGNLRRVVGDQPIAKVQTLAAYAEASALLAISHRLADLTDAIRTQGGDA